MSKTRFAELGFEQVDKGLWRFVCTESGRHCGPQYASKAELLADLERYAASYGCDGASKPAEIDWSKIRQAHDELHARLHGNAAASIERARDMLAAVLHDCGEF